MDFPGFIDLPGPLGWPSLWVFIRHGESEGNILTEDVKAHHELSTYDFPLTERGRIQVQMTRDWLSRSFLDDFDAKESSTYYRARQTLELLDPKGTHIENPLLDEREVGMRQVFTAAEFREAMPQEVRRHKRDGRYHHRRPGGRSFADTERDIWTYFFLMRMRFPDQRVLTVGHGNWFSAARRVLHGWSIEKMLMEDKTNHPKNASVSVYRFNRALDPPRFQLDQYNVTPWELGNTPAQ